MEVLVVLMFASSLFFHCGIAATDNKTDPNEVVALDAILRYWNIPFVGNKTLLTYNSERGFYFIETKYWNISARNPCTGNVVNDSDDERITNSSNSLGKLDILCLCDDDTSICNIIKFSAWYFNVSGTIPDALQNLTKLQFLDIEQNSLSGELPTFLWTFSYMKYMYLSNNNFNGPLPSQVGNLKNIQILRLSNNKFEGKIPNSLWNLTNLEILSLSDNNFDGTLPSLIGNLQNIQRLYLSNNKFEGKILNSLWNLTNLEILYLFGNNFFGSLPLEIGTMKNLKELVLGDNSFQGSIPSNIGNLVNLNILHLSSNKFEGGIPNSITKLSELRILDLSFNNLSGNLPPSIFNIPTLQSLYLNDNKFNGGLPDNKSDNLTIIDLSNNELEGRIPEWRKGVALNLVNNKFSVEESQKIQPRGLECLQKTTNCFTGKKLFTSFAINCGGEKIESSDGKTIFEADNIINNSASYYVADNYRWAVSFGAIYHGMIRSTKSITDTLDPELYLSARKSLTTLKYYGLGLKTGNYTVDLMFANIDGDNTYVFDVYIQGRLMFEDFEILTEMDALNLTYTVAVTENTKIIEISFVPKINSKVLISAINVTPNFKVGEEKKKGRIEKSTRIGLLVGLSIFILILCIVGYRLWSRTKY